MKDILLYIISLVVDNKEDISIDEKEDEGNIEFIVSLPKEEIGKVIGKQGRMIRAIRNVMKIPAIKQGKKISIAVQEK